MSDRGVGNVVTYLCNQIRCVCLVKWTCNNSHWKCSNSQVCFVLFIIVCYSSQAKWVLVIENSVVKIKGPRTWICSLIFPCFDVRCCWSYLAEFSPCGFPLFPIFFQFYSSLLCSCWRVVVSGSFRSTFSPLAGLLGLSCSILKTCQNHLSWFSWIVGSTDRIFKSLFADFVCNLHFRFFVCPFQESRFCAY